MGSGGRPRGPHLPRLGPLPATPGAVPAAAHPNEEGRISRAQTTLPRFTVSHPSPREEERPSRSSRAPGSGGPEIPRGASRRQQTRGRKEAQSRPRLLGIKDLSRPHVTTTVQSHLVALKTNSTLLASCARRLRKCRIAQRQRATYCKHRSPLSAVNLTSLGHLVAHHLSSLSQSKPRFLPGTRPMQFSREAIVTMPKISMLGIASPGLLTPRSTKGLVLPSVTEGARRGISPRLPHRP